MIVLACSRKLGGRCLAGVDTETGEWVRPVSGAGTGELYLPHCGIAGSYPELLTTVRFEHSGSPNDPAQPENVIVQDKEWIRTGDVDAEVAYDRLAPLLEDGPELFGTRDRVVPEQVASQGMPNSLAVIEPAEVEFHSQLNSFTGRRQSKVSFELSGQPYLLPLSDGEVEHRVRAAGLGTYTPAELDLNGREHLLLTISLPDVLQSQQARYTLAAAIHQVGLPV